MSRLVTSKLLRAHAWHRVLRISWTVRNLCVTDGTTWHDIAQTMRHLAVLADFVPLAQLGTLYCGTLREQIRASVRLLDSKGNYSATSNNTKFVHWPLMGGLLHLVQREEAWAGCGPAQSPPRCTKCNSPPINGQCTNHCSLLLYDGPLLCGTGFNVAIKGLKFVVAVVDLLLCLLRVRQLACCHVCHFIAAHQHFVIHD